MPAARSVWSSDRRLTMANARKTKTENVRNAGERGTAVATPPATTRTVKSTASAMTSAKIWRFSYSE